HIEVSDVADDADHAIAELSVHHLVENDLAGGGPFHENAIPEDGYGHHIPRGLDIECLIGGSCGPVASLGARHPLHQIEGFQGLHLISDGSRIAVYQFGDLLALYCSSFNTINVDQCG